MTWTADPPTEPGVYPWRSVRHAGNPSHWYLLALTGDGEGNLRVLFSAGERYPRINAQWATARSLRGEWGPRLGPVVRQRGEQ